MKKFIVILSGKKAKSLKSDLLNAHVEHLRTLHKNGFLFLCGPFADNDGAIQIINAKTKEDVEKMVLSDPFVENSYYSNFVIYELNEANEDNCYLLKNDKQTEGNLISE